MKTKKTMKQVLLLGALAATINVNAQAATDACVNMQENIPKNLFELAAKTRLTVDLTNNCTFQPVHYQVRTVEPTTEIIARFTGKKVGDDFAIEKVELKHFEVNENPRTVIIDDAYFKTDDNVKTIVVTLKNLDDPKLPNATQRKEQLAQEIVDFVLVPDTPEMVNRTMIIDIHIDNEEELYPEPEVLKAGTEEALGRPFGSHCKTEVAY